MEKSAEAFRTISEVADLLETPAHVLRFWESRFPQIRPVKRAGGRRYYRPSDIALLTGIKRLLHDDGLTIRGVQKVLREQGIRYVSDLPPQPGRPPRALLRRVAEADTANEADAESEAEAEAVVIGPDGPEANGADGHADLALPPAPDEARPPVSAAAPALPEAMADGLPAAPLPLWAVADPAPPAAPAPPHEARSATASPADSTAAPPPHQARSASPSPPDSTAAPSQEAAPSTAPFPGAAAAPPEAAPADDGVWLAARLRALPPALAAAREAELQALRDRLARLRARVSAARERPRP
jgi:DNA-binding transcriptional MerR regulator